VRCRFPRVWELSSTFASPDVPLVATSLPTGYHATIVSFNPGRHSAAVLSWADTDAAGPDADRVIIVPTIIVPVAVTAELNVHSLGFGRRADRRGRHDCYGCRRDESDLHHGGFLLLMRRFNNGGRSTVPQELAPAFLLCFPIWPLHCRAVILIER